MPQQMSDSQEKSDDLIAELAKLMATNAQGAEPEAKPALKLQPLSEVTVPPPAALRIPGMDSAPAPSAAPVSAPSPSAQSASAPPLRIPGMGQPVAAAPAPAPAMAPPAPAPQPKSSQFDFGRPPGVAPVIAPEPMTNWQARDVPKPAPQPQPVEPVLTVPLRSAPVEPATETPRPASTPTPAPEYKPSTSFKPAPVVAAPPVAPALSTAPMSNAPAGDGFDFDFGFGNESPASEEHQDHSEPSHDPIADLIAAELDSAETEDDAPETVEAPKPQAPAPAEPAPVRSFSNPNQAPVLVARPTGSRPAPTPAPRPAPQPQAQRAETDRFATAPVFGLGSKPASAPAPMPRGEPDPMDEIESLIGEAVRVELTPERAPTVKLAPPPVPTPTPVVPPLNTAFAPRRTELKDREPPMQSAEAAILAAAAATGARIDHLDGEDHRPVKRMKVKPPKSRGMSGGARQYLGMAVAGTLLLAAGLGLYWVLGMGRGDPSSAPVLTADTGSAKVPAPIVATAETAQPAATGLFNQLEGNVTPDPDETLVSRDETEGAAPTEVARVVGTEADDTEGGLANRKVRTVTVRPDGTIVPGDEAVAGNEVLPVDRPSVPAIPGGSVQPSELLASATTATAESDAIAAAIAGETPVTAEVDPNAVSALVATAPTTNTIDPTLVAPAPMPRPADRTTLVGGSQQAVNLVEPAIEAVAPSQIAVAPTAAARSGGSSGPFVQVSSSRSEAEAQQSLRNAQSRYSSLVSGGAPYVERADLGQKGIYYRVKLPTSTLQEATSVCATIKANGGDCFASGG
jgi:hypothetical protein